MMARRGAACSSPDVPPATVEGLAVVAGQCTLYCTHGRRGHLRSATGDDMTDLLESDAAAVDIAPPAPASWQQSACIAWPSPRSTTPCTTGTSRCPMGGPGSSRRRRDTCRHRCRPERTDGERRPRPRRRHPVAQARPGAPGADRGCATRGRFVMRRTRFDDWPCPIARVTDLVGDWWTPLVLRELFAGRSRFDDIQRALGCSRAVLAQRLTRLVEDGLLVKVPYAEHPPSPRLPVDGQGSGVLGRARGDGARTGCGRTARRRSYSSTATRTTSCAPSSSTSAPATPSTSAASASPPAERVGAVRCR